MCLGVPGRVLEVHDNIALVDFFGVSRQVRLELVDEPVAPGDYILNHVGFAIRRIPESDIEGTLAYATPGQIAEVLFDLRVRRPSVRFSESGTVDLGTGAPPAVAAAP